MPAALNLRRGHPSWGVGLTRVILPRQFPHQSWPVVPTVQRWLERAGLAPAPAGRRPAAESRRAPRPHKIGQMDAAEQVPLQTGRRVSWLRIADEWSGGVLGTDVFPQSHWNEVPPREVQQRLRRTFSRWGRPERLRVDNGAPWGWAGDLPTDLALWLIGLGVAMDWNPPRRPQDNGVIERSQETAKRWAEPFAGAKVTDLQRRLEEMDDLPRGAYPSVQGRSRLEAFPQLAHSGRAYWTAWERKHWSLTRVAVHRAGDAVRRRLDRCGLVSLYNRSNYVNSINMLMHVFIMFGPERLEWVIADREGRQLRRYPADEISQERIIGWTATNRRRRTSGQ